MPIDMGRAAMTRAKFDGHGKSGPKITMYKDEPGVYYDPHGKEVPAVVAKAAGFDIDAMEKTKTLNLERARLMQRYQDMLAPPPARTVEQVRPNGHKLVRIGDDLYHIQDIDGQQVTSAPLSKHYAIVWLDDLDPAGVEPEGEPLKFSPLSKEDVSLFNLETTLEGGDPKDADAQA